MREFTIGEHTYRTAQMDARKQLHIVRRMAPLLISLGSAGGAVKVEPGAGGVPRLIDADGKAVNPFKGLAGVGDVLAGMPDEAADYVIDACLGAVQRQQGAAWAPMVVGGVHMFAADLDLVTMLQIVWEVGQANLAGFTNTFRSLGLGSDQAGAAPSS